MNARDNTLTEAKFHALVSASPTHVALDRVGGVREVRMTLGQDDYLKAAYQLDPAGKAVLAGWLEEVGIDVVVPAGRTALYHTAPGRQYRPTKRELESGRFECPACHVILVRVTRKAKDALYRCPDCAWSIARSDIFDPEVGEEPALRDDVSYPEGIAPDPREEPGPW